MEPRTIADFTVAGTMPMPVAMPAAMPADDAAPVIEHAVDLAALVLRALAYAGFAAFASRYDCGQAILTGVFAGDAAASVVATAWAARDRRQALGELAVLGLVFLWVRAGLVWPDDQAQRAILGLAAFGVFVGRAGTTVLSHLGPRENGFA
jgi:hypothetical protein